MDPAGTPPPSVFRASASARSTASSIDPARSWTLSPASAKSRPSIGPLSPMRTAAAARSPTTRARSVRSTPLSRPPQMRTMGAEKAWSAAMTASGCVPWESLTYRTPSTNATVSSRCSTPVNPAAVRRIASGATPNSRPTATAASALLVLWRPGMASSPTGMTRPSGTTLADPPPTRRSRSTPSAVIQSSMIPTPPGNGRSMLYETVVVRLRAAYSAATGSSAFRTSAP